jgi:hypothetical protein
MILRAMLNELKSVLDRAGTHPRDIKIRTVPSIDAVKLPKMIYTLLHELLITPALLVEYLSRCDRAPVNLIAISVQDAIAEKYPTVSVESAGECLDIEIAPALAPLDFFEIALIMLKVCVAMLTVVLAQVDDVRPLKPTNGRNQAFSLLRAFDDNSLATAQRIRSTSICFPGQAVFAKWLCG